MRELEVREALKAGPIRKYLDDENSRVIDELAVCLGEARIDVAVVNGKLAGYELKSESDTLVRLPRQVEIYSRVFDEVTLVLDKRHTDAAIKIAPASWGVLEVSRTAKKTPRVVRIRPPTAAREQDPYSIAQLLWKSEVLEILARVTGNVANTSKPRAWLWRHLVDSLSLSHLKQEVRRALKLRSEWRS